MTPVSVAVDRSSNTESCLVLVLLLAAWALLRAAEEGAAAGCWCAMALVGVGFNVKMLAAFVVLPAFALVYLLGTPVAWRRRLVDLALGGLVLAVVSLSWGSSTTSRRRSGGRTPAPPIELDLELVVGPTVSGDSCDRCGRR